MKLLMVFSVLTTLLSATFANAAEVLAGRLISGSDSLEIRVAYTGGESEHSFRLSDFPFCTESGYPDCYAALIDDPKEDTGSGRIEKNIYLPMPRLNRGVVSLKIRGDNASIISITLPRAASSDEVPPN